MKKSLLLVVSVLLLFSLLTACGEETPSSVPSPSPKAGDAPQSSAAPTGGADAAPVSPQPAATAAPEETPPPVPEETEPPAASAVSLDFDPHAYKDPGDRDRYNALVYATNDGDVPIRADFRCRAYDKDGSVIQIYNPFADRYSEAVKDSVYIPAGVKAFPLGFALPSGYGYDLKADKEMPEIDHLEFELLDTQEEPTEDLRAHFTPGDPEIKENHIYMYMKFDGEIADNYTSLYADYTLLGYSDGVLTAVCCRNDYPYGTSSYSVTYALEHNDGALLVYHDVPRDPVDRWELYPGCIAGTK